MKYYIAIESFVDLQDGNHVYHPGDPFPRDGIVVSQGRIDELIGVHNKLGRALIKEVAEPVKKAVVETEQKAEVHEEAEAQVEASFSDKVKALGKSRTEINLMKTAELQEIAKDLGVENAEEMSGAAIKRLLIEALED